MDCRACHGSGVGSDAAKPAAGWVNDPNPERDYRLNILRCTTTSISDRPDYQAALAANGFRRRRPLPDSRAGWQADPLRRSAMPPRRSARRGDPGIAPLTRSMHAMHATVINPTNGMQMDDSRKPQRLLPMPSRLDHALPARRDGRGGRSRWLADNAVPELPRHDEPGGRGQSHRLAR